MTWWRRYRERLGDDRHAEVDGWHVDLERGLFRKSWVTLSVERPLPLGRGYAWARCLRDKEAEALFNQVANDLGACTPPTPVVGYDA